jgi:DNA-binding CsgD family transcriptional regulator
MSARSSAEALVMSEPSGGPDIVSELTSLALASACRAEFRGRALALLSQTVGFDRAVWEEIPPFGESRVVYPGVTLLGNPEGRPAAAAGAEVEEGACVPHVGGRPSGAERPRAIVRLDLERFGRTRAVLTVERTSGAFEPGDLDRLRALLPTLILADEGTAVNAGPSRALTPREADVVEYVRLGYTNAQIALATGRSVAAIRNLLVRVFDKTGVRTRAQLVGGPLSTSGLTRREREIVEKLRTGLTNREIGRALGISTNTVRNTLARLFEKVGVSTRSELMGALSTEDPGSP